MIRPIHSLLTGLALLVLAFFPGSPAEAAGIEGAQVIEIRVLPEAAVYGESYQLGDIAELDGFDIDLIQKLATVEVGKSPLPGRSQRVTKSQIESRLNGLIHPDQYQLLVPKTALVSRASIKISGSQLKEIISEEITKQFKDFKEVNVTLVSRIDDQFVPKGKASYRIARIGQPVKAGGVGSWAVGLEVDTKLFKKLVVRAKVEVIDEVVVAKDDIPKGKTIEEADLVTVEKDVSKLPQNYQSSSELVVGQQAKRQISQNESVRVSLVEEPIVLEKGQPVRLVYQNDKIYLSNIAIALRSGKKGEVVPVRTVDGKKTVYARIVDSEQVEVAL
ncbi:MAG: flagella basal body P-ring formation protein FlgA [Candidatus Lambdaproteobacteria bacterium RIFOXYD2_FULL_50_16]|uniref:Flagella basal body P-ring formation protein FlgA n=1 Tax=Candidatus Lambdaproteobacteria bacterium RIFOXYD2_FULL_50_16 TaxID=1817772 RepID=A0A1F6GAZ6_9PROT|nr:MAG: flagella basal body P-ring formation protein FlgA [Candidatus Lambdaproteobacteria bacterium RIFOXYD2_FULL_50_16]